MFEQIHNGIESTSRLYLLSNDDIIAISVILLFVLFTFVLYRSRIIFVYKFRTFFSSRQIYSSNEISTSNEEFVDIILLILIGCISISTIIYSDIIYIGKAVAKYDIFLLIFLCLALLIIAKGAMYSFINWIFFDSDKGRTWLSAFFFSIAVVSTIAFPLSLLKIFLNNEIINTTFLLIGIAILHKILLLCKLYVNFRPKRYGCLIFFLYFCSVEIMPTLIAWHIVQGIIM